MKGLIVNWIGTMFKMVIIFIILPIVKNKSILCTTLSGVLRIMYMILMASLVCKLFN